MNKSRALNRLRTEIRRRNYSYKTEQSYSQWVKRLFAYVESHVDNTIDEESVTAYTDYGCLSVSGSGLHVEELNIANGILDISGEVTALIYSSKTSKEKNIFKRLFGA